MVVNGLAGGLNKEYVSAADGFFQRDGSLTVSKSTNGTLTQLDTELIADCLCEGRIGIAAKNLDVITICNHRKYTSLISIFGSGLTFSHTPLL
jgi:hypothetical protein